MDNLLAVIAELGLELHPDRIDVIAAKVDTLGSVEQFALLKSSFGPNADKELISRFDQAWNNNKKVGLIRLKSAFDKKYGHGFQSRSRKRSSKRRNHHVHEFCLSCHGPVGLRVCASEI